MINVMANISQHNSFNAMTKVITTVSHYSTIDVVTKVITTEGGEYVYTDYQS